MKQLINFDQNFNVYLLKSFNKTLPSLAKRSDTDSRDSSTNFLLARLWLGAAKSFEQLTDANIAASVILYVIKYHA